MGIQISDGNGASAEQGSFRSCPVIARYKRTVLTKQFKMELSWLSREEFRELVAKIWNKPVIGQNALES